MAYKDPRYEKGKDIDIRSLRGNVKEVLSYVSLVLSRSAMNPFILTRMESEIGLSLEAIRSILMKIDEIIKYIAKENLMHEKVCVEDILSWISFLKRFQVVLENLPVALGPYGDFEIFSLSLNTKENLSDIVDFLEDLLKRSRQVH